MILSSGVRIVVFAEYITIHTTNIRYFKCFLFMNLNITVIRWQT